MTGSELSWTPQIYISVISAAISVIGATVSWFMARQKYRWDVGKELSPLRAKTLSFVSSTLFLDHPSWTIGATQFCKDRAEWWSEVEDKRLLLGSKGYNTLSALDKLFYEVENTVFGFRRVTTEDAVDDSNPRQMTIEQHNALIRFQKQVTHDLWLFSR